jgi:hypothetical protein
LKSKKTTTKDDNEFIETAHNASQAYIELANRAFKDKSALSGENSEKFQTLKEVGLYVDRIAKQQQRSDTSD